MLSIEIFLGVMGVFLSLLLALLIPILVNLLGMRGDLKPIISLGASVDSFLRQRGLLNISVEATDEHQSLPPEKASERDTLISIGRYGGLTEVDAARLRALLEEDARDELARGLIGAIAFALIMIAIGGIIKSLQK